MGGFNPPRRNQLKSTNKYIGINQRVPFDVLDAALYRSLRDNTVEKEPIITHMREFTKGENRLLKAAGYAAQILSKHKKLMTHLGKNFTAETYVKLPESDRKAICLCLSSLTYPVIYDLLITLATGFKVQPKLNRQFINLKMAAIYGSNRSIYNALDAIIPMIIEFETIERIKTSLYSMSPKSVISHQIIKELVVFTDIKLSGSKSILVDDLQYRPWYMFFDITFNEQKKFTLFKFSESRIGQGYLKID